MDRLPLIGTRAAHARAAAVIALTALGLLARATCRPDRSYWFDEAVTLAQAQGSWRELWGAVVTSEANASLHTLLLRGWLQLAGVLGASDELFSARLLSALIGAAAIPVVYALGRRLLGHAAGLIAAALLAANQFHVYYSAEARTYALATLLALVSSWLVVRALAHPSWPRWAIYGVVAAASAYAHFFCGLVVAAHLAAAPFFPGDSGDRRRRWRYLLATPGLLLLLTGPLLLFVLHSDRSQTAWIPRPDPDSVAQLLLAMAGRVRSVGALRLGRALLAIVEVGLVLLAVGSAFAARREADPRRSWSVWFLVSWAVVPVALALLLSLDRPLFVTRYLLVVVPAWLLLVAAGLLALGSRRVVGAGVAATLFLSLSGTLQPRPDDPPASIPFDEAARRVLAAARPEDALAFSHPAGVVPFDYYRRRLGGTGAAMEWPADGRWLGSRADEDGAVLARLRRHDRIWFVLFAEAADAQRIRAALEPEYQPAPVFDRAGVRVLRYERRAR